MKERTHGLDIQSIKMLFRKNNSFHFGVLGVRSTIIWKKIFSQNVACLNTATVAHVALERLLYLHHFGPVPRLDGVLAELLQQGKHRQEVVDVRSDSQGVRTAEAVVLGMVDAREDKARRGLCGDNSNRGCFRQDTERVKHLQLYVRARA